MIAEFTDSDDVVILDEHMLKDENGKPIIYIGPARLRYIAERANQRIKDTGDETPVVIGHTKDDADEDDQPEIVGFARNFRVKQFFKTGKKAIYATISFLTSKLERIKQFPRRSVELWLSDWKIDPISLLGATTPERDLGLLRLSRDGARKYRRVVPNMDPKEIVNGVVAALKESDVWKWAEAQMAKEGGEGDEGGLPPEEDEEGLPAEEGGGVPPGAAGGMGGEGGGEQPVREFEEEQPAQYEMGGGAPGAAVGQTYVPGPLGSDRRRMARDAERVRMARYDKVLKGQQAQIDTLVLKLRRSEREKDLIQLEGEGIDFDRAEELEDLLDLADDKYKARLNRMRKRYQKDPTHVFDVEGSSRKSGAIKQPRSKEAAMKAAEYAQRKGIPYEDALAQLDAEAV